MPSHFNSGMNSAPRYLAMRQLNLPSLRHPISLPNAGLSLGVISLGERATPSSGYTSQKGYTIDIDVIVAKCNHVGSQPPPGDYLTAKSAMIATISVAHLKVLGVWVSEPDE